MDVPQVGYAVCRLQSFPTGITRGHADHAVGAAAHDRWPTDLPQDELLNGQEILVLTILDKFTRMPPAIVVHQAVLLIVWPCCGTSSVTDRIDQPEAGCAHGWNGRSGAGAGMTDDALPTPRSIPHGYVVSAWQG